MTRNTLLYCKVDYAAALVWTAPERPSVDLPPDASTPHYLGLPDNELDSQANAYSSVFFRLRIIPYFPPLNTFTCPSFSLVSIPERVRQPGFGRIAARTICPDTSLPLARSRVLNKKRHLSVSLFVCQPSQDDFLFFSFSASLRRSTYIEPTNRRTLTPANCA
jgi:hypothetical protein